eukprot:12532682-Heterocapsa_arctica.AAC.1
MHARIAPSPLASPSPGLQAFFSPARPQPAASTWLRADGTRNQPPQNGSRSGTGSPLTQRSPEEAYPEDQLTGASEAPLISRTPETH